MLRLLFNEKIIKQYKVLKKNAREEITFTNYRIYIPFYPENSVYYQDIINFSKACDTKGNQYLGKLLVNSSEKQKSIHFQFLSEKDMEEFEKTYSLIEIFKEKDELSLLKFKELSENTSLLQAYETLVMKETMSESDFWQNRPIFQEYNKVDRIISQPLSKTLKPIRNSLYKRGNEFKLTENDRLILLKREPKLKEKYIKNVIEKGINEDIFWDNFIADQKTKETIIVGEYNPIYIDKDEEFIREINPEIEVDINNNLEIYDNSNEKYSVKYDESNLIDSLNKKNRRILIDELQKNKKDFLTVNEIDIFPEIQPKNKNIVNFNNNNSKAELEKNRKNIDLIDEKGRNNWNSFKLNINEFYNKINHFKEHVFIEENINLWNIFEQSMKNIHSKLIGNLKENKLEPEIDKQINNFHKESNELLKFFYSFENKIKKEKKEENIKKNETNLIEILKLIKQKKEQIINFKQKINKQSKILLNIEDRLDFALKTNNLLLFK